MLDRENIFYEAHRAEFREKYLDKWLVITGESLWGVYDTTAEAVKTVLEDLEGKEVMIHRPADDGKIIEIGPRVRVKYPEDGKKPKQKAKMIYTDSGGSMKVPYAR